MADATGEPRAEPVRVSGWLSPEAQRLMSGSNDPLEGALQAQGMPRGRRVSWDEDPEAYEAQRDASDAAMAAFLEASVGHRELDVEERHRADVTVYVVTPDKFLPGADDYVYFYVHGGALVGGGGPACRADAKRMALTTRMVTWGPDYRLPPRFPYPTPLDDCVEAYKALLEVQPPERTVAGGASAGGNLVTALMLHARDEGLPLPAALVLISPELDLTEQGDSFASFGSLMEANLLYAGGHDLSDPYVSPLYGDPHDFPPTFIQAGTRDLFLSNCVVMHRKLRALDIDAELHCWEAMPHGGFGGAPEDREITVELRKWLTKHVA